jgi:hypothetical protein
VLLIFLHSSSAILAASAAYDYSLQYHHTAASRMVATVSNGREPLLEAQVDAEND